MGQFFRADHTGINAENLPYLLVNLRSMRCSEATCRREISQMMLVGQEEREFFDIEQIRGPIQAGPADDRRIRVTCVNGHVMLDFAVPPDDATMVYRDDEYWGKKVGDIYVDYGPIMVDEDCAPKPEPGVPMRWRTLKEGEESEFGVIKDVDKPDHDNDNYRYATKDANKPPDPSGLVPLPNAPGPGRHGFSADGSNEPGPRDSRPSAPTLHPGRVIRGNDSSATESEASLPDENRWPAWARRFLPWARKESSWKP